MAAARFERDTAVESMGEGLYRGQIDRGWWVVAGPNGGYLAAIVLRAAETALDDPSRAPRSFTIHYTARPVEGPVEIEARIERSGRSLTTLSLRVTQEGRLIAIALAAFSKPRTSIEFQHAGRPEVIPLDSADAPPFRNILPIHERFELRWAVPETMFGAGDRARSGAWIRLAEPMEPNYALVAAITDAVPPAVFAAMKPEQIGGGVPTIDLNIHFRAPLPQPGAGAEDFLLALFQTRVLREGFLEEDGEIWTRDGVLLAQSRQLAIFT